MSIASKIDQHGAALVREPHTIEPSSPWLVTTYGDAIARLQVDNRVDVFTEGEARNHLANLPEKSMQAYQLQNAINVAWPKAGRIVVKVSTECGNSWITPINATLAGARKYFMGVVFMHVDETPMGPVVRVEEAEEVKA